MTDAGGVDLAGRTALVTGASRGIGAGIAKSLGSAGVRLALVARNKERLDEVATNIGNESLTIAADLSRESDASAAAHQVLRAFGGPPDILISNAGVFQISPLSDTSVDDFSKNLTTNLLAPFVFVRAFLSGMLERRSGHIITIGSVSDRTIFPGNGAYAATKFGARAMHEVLRAETTGTGVRVTLVSPSAVNTEIWDPIKFSDGSVPVRDTMLHPSAVANAVVFALTQPDDVNIDELRLSRS